jgi:uncharacterized protein
MRGMDILCKVDKIFTLDRFLIRLENRRAKYSSSNTMELLRDLRRSVDPFRTVIKNLRVSELAIEFDLYAPSEEAKLKSVAVLESGFGTKLSERNLGLDESPPDKVATLEASIRLFNEQRYWECHETMEQAWRKLPKGPEKDVQQGLILSASAMVHYQKGENEVCLNMIPRTLTKLNAWEDSKYYSLDVSKLKQNLLHIYESRVIRPFTL